LKSNYLENIKEQRISFFKKIYQENKKYTIISDGDEQAHKMIEIAFVN